MTDPAIPSPIETVTNFFAEWSVSHQALLQSYRDYFTTETAMSNVGINTTVGIESHIEIIARVREETGLARIHVEILGIAAFDEHVFTERIDTGYDDAGRELFRIPCAGVLEVRDGKILGWRDYIDASGVPLDISDALTGE